MKILIVDDSKTMRMMLKRTLRNAGFSRWTFEEAGNGAEALEVIAAASPDVVLSDWAMPGMNGLELLRTLRSTDSDAIFGFVTSGTEEKRTAASEAGAEFLIAKPFTTESVQQALTDALTRARTHAHPKSSRNQKRPPELSHRQPLSVVDAGWV